MGGLGADPLKSVWTRFRQAEFYKLRSQVSLQEL